MKKWKAGFIAATASMLLFFGCDNGDDDDSKTSDENSYPIQYTVLFDANGGTISTTKEEVSYRSEDRLKDLYTPEELGLSYDGHIFYGWNTQADGKGLYFQVYGAAFTKGEKTKVYQIFLSKSGLDMESGGTATLYAQWINPDEKAATANSDGTYTVTPYNFEATLKTLSESGATEAKFIVKEVTENIDSFEKNWIEALNGVLKQYESISVTLDLSESYWLRSVRGSSLDHITSGFSKCTNIKEIVLPEGLTRIDSYAFYGCTSLSAITLPSTLSKTGADAFAYSNTRHLEIKKVVYSGTIEKWCQIDFSAFYHGYPLSNGGTFLFNGEELKEVVIPDSITKINAHAFCNMASIEKVTIPNTVTWIGTEAFCNCENIKEIELPENITQIVTSTFAGCSNLQKITIPANVIDISCNAFHDCGNLSSAIFKDTSSVWYHYDSKTKAQTSIGSMSSSSDNAQKLRDYSDNYDDTLYTAKSSSYKAE